VLSLKFAELLNGQVGWTTREVGGGEDVLKDVSARMKRVLELSYQTTVSPDAFSHWLSPSDPLSPAIDVAITVCVLRGRGGQRHDS
jgi:hypothetical protein